MHANVKSKRCFLVHWGSSVFLQYFHKIIIVLFDTFQCACDPVQTQIYVHNIKLKNVLILTRYCIEYCIHKFSSPQMYVFVLFIYLCVVKHVSASSHPMGQAAAMRNISGRTPSIRRLWVHKIHLNPSNDSN